VQSVIGNIDDEAALLTSLATVAQLAYNDAAVAALVEGGGVDAILVALKKYPAKVEVVEGCCAALCRLLINEQVAIKVGQGGGIPMLIKAMRAHFQSERVAETDMILLVAALVAASLTRFGRTRWPRWKPTPWR
jgi:hypothetical protein